MKIVLNKCFGGFCFSRNFREEYPQFENEWDIDRTNVDMIAALEEFGLDRASTTLSHLVIVEIPDCATDWEIDDYDGIESVIYVVNGRLKHI